jgi:hypothetical protein
LTASNHAIFLTSAFLSRATTNITSTIRRVTSHDRVAKRGPGVGA